MILLKKYFIMIRYYDYIIPELCYFDEYTLNSIFEILNVFIVINDRDSASTDDRW